MSVLVKGASSFDGIFSELLKYMPLLIKASTQKLLLLQITFEIQSDNFITLGSQEIALLVAVFPFVLIRSIFVQTTFSSNSKACTIFTPLKIITIEKIQIKNLYFILYFTPSKSFLVCV